MSDVKVKLLRPLNGQEVGTEAEYSEADAKRLEACGAVRIVRAKAESAPENKMDAAPANKSTKSRKA